MSHSSSDLPRIDIIFVVRFDTKRGNVLEWTSDNEEDLSGIEFSAMPSGLHNVSSDVIYFRHREYVGVAAYVSVAIDSVADRGALMAAVGVLIKPCADSGRCGQVWRHVEFLQSQAKNYVSVGADTSALEEYWQKNKAMTEASSPLGTRKRDSYRSLSSRRVNRSFTLSEPLMPTSHMQYPSIAFEHEQSTEDIHPSHPSHRVLEFVHQLGPAIFVIWKAALLKKRILICTSTPVEAACLAGTTDALFRYKPELYDYLIELPGQSLTPNSQSDARPFISITVNTPEGVKLEKVSHNVSDSRRYILLLRVLSHHRRQQQWFEHRRSLDQQQLLQRQQQQESFASAQEYDDQLDSEAARLLDPTTDSISANQEPGQTNGATFGFNMSGTLSRMLAGGWWWWYGGDDEFDLPAQDHGMALREGATILPSNTADDDSGSLRGTNLDILEAQIKTSPEMECIRFFHNLTKNLLVQLDRLLQYKSTAAIFHLQMEDERVYSQPTVEVTRKDLQQLGLDPVVDGPFVSNVYQVYFNKEVKCPPAHRGLGLIDLVVGTCAICCVDRGDPETTI
ncbi:hypothetical protein BGZ73_007214 [Actinomortierella ambigua]|nr:hypothetical protein BGZ73_007214 [Actinomortierella ambigua]